MKSDKEYVPDLDTHSGVHSESVKRRNTPGASNAIDVMATTTELRKMDST